MSVLNQFWDLITGTNKEGPQTAATLIPYDYTKLYSALYDMYNNDDSIATDDTTRRLRTVVNRSVEFYAAKMVPGKKIGVTADNEQVKAAIEQVIKDSNLGNNKPAMLRGFSLYGDSFVRVRGDDKKVYLEDVSPFFVTDFAEDSLGFLTYIRIDIPIIQDSNVEAETGTPANYTEYWDLDDQTYRSWVTLMSPSTPIKQLGEPQETISFAELGIDFIPIVHTKFKDNGDLRGQGCVYHVLDKIYEANRLATRLHDILFQFGKPIWAASANSKDAAGRPLPAPRVEATASGNASVGEATKESVFGTVIYLPGMSSLEALIPNIDYSDALAILNAQMEELEKDLPELRWYSLNPTSQTALSGTALRTLLGAAVDRANEARNNFLSSMSRMLEMALTIGIFNGLFPNVSGSFDDGSFDHELQVDDSWGESTEEKGTTMQALTQAGIPAPAAMKLAGFTEEQVKEAFPNGIQPPTTPPGGTKTPNITGKITMVAGKPVVKVN